MKLLLKFCFVVFCLVHPIPVPASVLRIDGDRIYSRLTVRIGDQVPRQLCRKLLDHLEVRLG